MTLSSLCCSLRGWVRTVALGLLLTTLTACSMNDQPNRYQELPLFNPHRKDFTCVHQDTKVPPIDAQADIWFQEALALEADPTVYQQKRDYGRIVKLYTQAAERKHWKAMLNLAQLQFKGYGMAIDDEAAVKKIEAAMALGIPGAYYQMSAAYQNGWGVPGNRARAYAFLQRAAEMGSPEAQTFLGEKLKATWDSPEDGFWANRIVGLKMMGCAFAQGYGKAAYELGITTNPFNGASDDPKQDSERALFYFQQGVKFGSADSANYLASAFGRPTLGRSINPGGIDKAREERYELFAKALEHNDTLRFPNLDAVLPLPPAKIPKWNGDEEALLNAAKPVLEAARPPAPTPGADLSGRAHIPSGQVLPARALPPQQEMVTGYPVTAVEPQFETTVARYSGYWLPQVLRPTTSAQLNWDKAQAPQYYARGEQFENRTMELRRIEAARILWHYRGNPVAAPVPALTTEVRVGLWRQADTTPKPWRRCHGDAPCPHDGVWQPVLAQDQLTHVVVNTRNRQVWLRQGASFPDPQRDWHLDIAADAIAWYLMDSVGVDIAG